MSNCKVCTGDSRCNYPLCQSEEDQQAIAAEVYKNLVGETPADKQARDAHYHGEFEKFQEPPAGYEYSHTACDGKGCEGCGYIGRAPQFPPRDVTKPAEAQGIFDKFQVSRTDGSSQPGGKHHGCKYFVLDLDHDIHAKAAMRAYGRACRDTHPVLSRQILTMMAADIPHAPAIGSKWKCISSNEYTVLEVFRNSKEVPTVLYQAPPRRGVGDSSAEPGRIYTVSLDNLRMRFTEVKA